MQVFVVWTLILRVPWSLNWVIVQGAIPPLDRFVFIEWPSQDPNIAIDIGRRLISRGSGRRRIRIRRVGKVR